MSTLLLSQECLKVQKMDFSSYIKVNVPVVVSLLLYLLQIQLVTAPYEHPFLHILCSCSLVVTNFFFQRSVVIIYVMLYLQGSMYHGIIYAIS